MGVTRRCAMGVVVCALAAPAHGDGLDGERFVPAVGAEGSFVVEHPAVPSHLGWSLGLFVNVADDQVVERAGDTILRRPLDLGATADLIGSLGLFRRLELGVHLPVHLVYGGDPYPTGGTTLTASPGVGDLRFVTKLVVLRRGDAEPAAAPGSMTRGHHFLLGFALPITVPTGNDDELRGAGGVTIEPRILVAAHLGRLGLGISLGYLWRARHPPTLPWGDELTLGPWLSFGVTGALTVRAELFGGKHVRTPVDGADLPLELLGGLDYAIGNVDLYAGASFGLTDGIGDPDVRVIAGVRYRRGSPRRQGFGDSDGDRILDKDDDCPDAAEDEDGFRDTDGCPEPDNDHDGIADGDDECPELSGDRGHHGCPARTYVKIIEGKIFIFGKVQFRSGSTDIDHNSEPLLDQIGQALDASPQVKKIRIEGHTDNVGDPAMNERLSEQRAESVKAALVKRGIDRDRLETRGLGETRPIAPNASPGGRQTNRRVEFIIVGGS